MATQLGRAVRVELLFPWTNLGVFLGSLVEAGWLVSYPGDGIHCWAVSAWIWSCFVALTFAYWWKSIGGMTADMIDEE